MNTGQLVDNGYSQTGLKRFRRARWRRRSVRFLLVLFLMLATVFAAATYFSRLPRERHARDFNFVERAYLGAKRSLHAAFLTISAEQEDGARSRLPIAELYIRGKRLDKLKKNLPMSGRVDQKAKFHYADDVFKVKARFRGDSINHWAFPQKSWRIDMRKTDDVDGMRALNLNVPRSDNQISNWLGYELARRLGGMLVPESAMVHFRLNRKYDGVRLLLEQPDEAFLRRRRLPPGKIFIGDISSEQIYGDVPRARLYHEAGAWQVRTSGEDVGRGELAALFRGMAQKDTYRRYYKLQKLVDVESFLRFMALLEFVGSIHIDATHNGKMFFNPVSGTFTPIVWDTVAYFWGNTQPLDLGTNELFQAMLSVPEFRARKDAILWEMVQGNFSTRALHTLIDQQTDRMRKDVYAFPLKLHANDKGVRYISNPEWEASVETLRRAVAERNERIVSHLGNEEVTWQKTSPGDGSSTVRIFNRGSASVTLKEIAVRTSAPSVSITRKGLDAVLKKVRPELRRVRVSVKDGVARFQADDILHSARSFAHGSKGQVQPAVYEYEIAAEGGALEGVDTPVVVSALTTQPVQVASEETESDADPAVAGWWSPEEFVAIDTKELSGTVTVTEDLVLDDYTRLVIAPGTTVQLAPERSILVRKGGLVARGTPDQPIVFTSASGDYPFGTVAVQGGKAELANVTVQGGTERKLRHVWYEAPLSLYGADIQIQNLALENSTVSLRDCEGAIDGLSYTGIQRVGYTVDGPPLKITGVTNNTREPVHRWADYQGKTYGTSARAEREFKLTLAGTPIQTMTLEEIAAAMHAALTDATDENPAMWNAPQETGTQYYHDGAAKEFLFRDIYFDTKDRLNYQFGVSYRYRNRYKSNSKYEAHLKKPNWEEFWPYRLEFQAKVNRKELPGGYSTTDESRFEFRAASSPFSETNLPPPPPWDEDEFVPHFLAGQYKGIPTKPARAIMEFLRLNGVQKDELEFEPTAVLVTDRFRQHLNIKSPWGSGPNPEQSFIISLDRSRVFYPKPYLDYLRRKRLGYKKLARPVPDAIIVEVEMEFERNVSDVLDREIEDARASGQTEELAKLERARDAFLADQQVIKNVLTEHFAKQGIDVIPADKSKYLQAIDLLNQ